MRTAFCVCLEFSSFCSIHICSLWIIMHGFFFDLLKVLLLYHASFAGDVCFREQAPHVLTLLLVVSRNRACSSRSLPQTGHG